MPLAVTSLSHVPTKEDLVAALFADQVDAEVQRSSMSAAGDDA